MSASSFASASADEDLEDDDADEQQTLLHRHAASSPHARAQATLSSFVSSIVYSSLRLTLLVLGLCCCGIFYLWLSPSPSCALSAVGDAAPALRHYLPLCDAGSAASNASDASISSKRRSATLPGIFSPLPHVPSSASPAAASLPPSLDLSPPPAVTPAAAASAPSPPSPPASPPPAPSAAAVAPAATSPAVPSQPSDCLPPLTPVSNTDGVRCAAEPRLQSFIHRRNYAVSSTHIFTLPADFRHPLCSPRAPNSTAFECAAFNYSVALAGCAELAACVAVTCWKWQYTGCQLRPGPPQHGNNHRFVSFYKNESVVMAAEEDWWRRDQQERQTMRRGSLGIFHSAPCGSGSKCVVSMGLYGRDLRYTANAVINAQLLPAVMPGWTLRVYHDRSVPAAVLRNLSLLQAELRDMSSSALQGATAGMYWRFLVSEDDSVDRWLIRDSDSRPTQREAAAVAEWISSGYSVHIMRDHPNHGRAMMGGMWGAVRGAVRNVSALIRSAHPSLAQYNADQEFLAQHLYPLIRHDQLAHDSWYCLQYPNSRPFPTPRRHWNDSFTGMAYGKDGEGQLNGDIRCCLVEEPAPVACRRSIHQLWG